MKSASLYPDSNLIVSNFFVAWSKYLFVQLLRSMPTSKPASVGLLYNKDDEWVFLESGSRAIAANSNHNVAFG